MATEKPRRTINDSILMLVNDPAAAKQLADLKTAFGNMNDELASLALKVLQAEYRRRQKAGPKKVEAA